MNEKMCRVALVGAGYVSAYHARALQTLKHVQITAIVDPDRERAQARAGEFGIPQVFTAVEELSSAPPDVIHILTPPASHCRLTMAALELGCHVLVEKPLATTTEECERMMERAAAAGRVLSVNHSAKFGPAVQQALKLIGAGAIGEVVAVDYIRGSDYPAYSGGSMPPHYGEGGYAFRDIGVHALYLIEAVLGRIVKTDAQYRSSGRHPHLPFDEWRVQVECEKGIGQAHLSWTSRPMRNMLLIQGTHGAIEADLFLETCALQRVAPGPKVTSLVWNSTFARLGNVLRSGWNIAQFAAGRIPPSADIHQAVREFHLALQARGEAFVTAEEGSRIVAWVDRIARQADLDHCRRLHARKTSPTGSILVTGGSGFLGRAVVNALLGEIEEGETIRVLSRRELPEHPCISMVQGDLGDPEVVDRAVQGVDTIYHVGAATNGGPAEYQAGTITGTRNMVEAALRHGVKKFVYVSSLSVLDYAGLAPNARVNESAGWEPAPELRGLYTSSKLEAEKIVLDAAREHGLPAVIVRPGQIFGPGAEKVPPYGTISVGSRWVVMGAGGMKLPLVYVDDVADGLLRAARTEVEPGCIIQLVDPEVIDQKIFVRQVQQRCPELKATFAPLPFLYCAAVGLELLGRVLKRSVPLTRYRLRSLRGDLDFDCSRARMQIGWTPRIGVREGLRRTYAAQAL
jgi:predicted dehydrogenase/nucleoside-diphosphate-sugar epimerase